MLLLLLLEPELKGMGGFVGVGANAGGGIIALKKTM
jgi:hypothetical protein